MVGLDYLFVLAHDIVLKRKELKKLLFCASKVRIVLVASMKTIIRIQCTCRLGSEALARGRRPLLGCCRLWDFPFKH